MDRAALERWLGSHANLILASGDSDAVAKYNRLEAMSSLQSDGVISEDEFFKEVESLALRPLVSVFAGQIVEPITVQFSVSPNNGTFVAHVVTPGVAPVIVRAA